MTELDVQRGRLALIVAARDAANGKARETWSSSVRWFEQIYPDLVEPDLF